MWLRILKPVLRSDISTHIPLHLGEIECPIFRRLQVHIDSERYLAGLIRASKHLDFM